MTRRIASQLLLILWALSGAATVQAQAQPMEGPLAEARTHIVMKDWEKATREVAKAEKKGLCKGAYCLALRATIAERSGDGAKALEQARQAVPLFGPESGLDANLYNELGVIFYRQAKGNKELLQLAEKALRNAEAAYTRDASNIRFNLSEVLAALGRKSEAKAIMDKLEAEGILIDPQMSVLGNFQGVEINN
jgi:tetratricopeptide (TPR) repeat protein